MLDEPAACRRIADSLVQVSAFCFEGTNVTLLQRGAAQQKQRRVITRLTPIGASHASESAISCAVRSYRAPAALFRSTTCRVAV